MTNESLSGLGIGRIVHHLGSDEVHRAAIVTDIVTAPPVISELPVISEPGVVSLAIFGKPQDEAPLGFQPSCLFDPSGTIHNTWHWPERVE